MAYADLDNLLSDYLPLVTKDSQKESVGRILDSVSAFADTYCRRAPGYFNPASDTPSMKRVRGEDQYFLRLPIHVFGSIESVTLNGVEIDSSLYYESQKNFWLYLEGRNAGPGFCASWSERWEDGQVYKVTARWGYASTPADLQEAVRQIVVQFWNATKGIFGQVTPTDFVITGAIPDSAQLILDKYKRREFEI